MYQKNRQRPAPFAPQYNPANTAPQYPQSYAPQAATAPQQPQQPPQYPPSGTPNPVQPYRGAQPQNSTYPQQNTQRPPQNDYSAPESNASDPTSAEYIDGKILKHGTTTATMDFSCRLVKAFPKDYASIHGCGGTDHAPNSGIQLSIYDFSKGKANAVSVSAIIDVHEIYYLYEAAKAAAFGYLGLHDQMKAARQFAIANGMVIGWTQADYTPTRQDLVSLQQTLGTGLQAQDPDNLNQNAVAWSRSLQKTNPYKARMENGKKVAPTSFVNILYYPGRNYPWTLHVVNCTAPIGEKENGAMFGYYKQATDKSEAMFHLTAADFLEDMRKIVNYINGWEHRMYPVIDAMCTERERRIAAKHKKNNK